MEKARLRDGETLYLEIDDYYAFEQLMPHLAGLDISLNELNDLAGQLARLDTTQGIAYRGLLEQFEVQDIGTAILLAERMDEYILTPEISSPQETAVDQLRFLLDDAAAEQLIPHVNLFCYGNEVIQHDNAALTPYGLPHRTDYQPMLSPSREKMRMEMQ